MGLLTKRSRKNVILQAFVTSGRHHEVHWRMDSRWDHLGVSDAVRLIRFHSFCSHVENEAGVPYSSQVRRVTNGCWLRRRLRLPLVTLLCNVVFEWLECTLLSTYLSTLTQSICQQRTVRCLHHKQLLQYCLLLLFFSDDTHALPMPGRGSVDILCVHTSLYNLCICLTSVPEKASCALLSAWSLISPRKGYDTAGKAYKKTLHVL